MNNRTEIEERPQIIRKYVEPVLIAGSKQRGDAQARFAWLYRQISTLVCGPPSSLFISEVTGQPTHIACCYPIEHEIALEGIQCRTLDAGEVLAIVHYGPHATLGESWEILFDYIERHNIPVKGPRREIYLRHTGADAEQYVTELQVPLNSPVSELGKVQKPCFRDRQS